MTRHQFSQPASSSAPSSLSTRQRNLSRNELNSNNNIRTQTLLTRLFRRKERSPSALQPLTLDSDANATRILYGEEEETKTYVDSPMRALLRSLSLQRSGRTRPEVVHTTPSATLQVLVDGVFTELFEQNYWHVKPSYFILEQSMESKEVRFTLRQFQYLIESRKPGQLMAIITLSRNDLVMDLQTHQQMKSVLELQLATREQRTNIDIEEREKEICGSKVIRLASVDERTHAKWLNTLNACISRLVAETETQYRRRETSAAWIEPAKIMPMFAQEGQKSRVLTTREREENGSALSCTSSECSNNNHSEREFPAEEIRAAKQDVAREDELKSAACNVQTARVLSVVAMEELTAQTVGDYNCCTSECRANESIECPDVYSDDNAVDEKTENNHENNQDDDDSEEDFVAGDLATQSSVAQYKSAVLAGKGISPYQSIGMEDEYTKTSSQSTVAVATGNGRLSRAAFGATSSSNSLFPMLGRPQTHSFNANGQVFTLDTRYQLVKPIGNGAYGAVVAVKDVVSDGDHLAVKKITNIFEDLVDAKRILREVRLLGHFNHKNITRLLDLSPPLSRKHFGDMYIITELMETDLHQVIYSMQPMSDDHVKYFLYQMLCALHHIHSAGVLHRDVKPSNILLNANCDLKMCDFGLARGGVGSSTEGQQDAPELGELTEYVVTRWYRAPEIMLNCRDYTTAIDVWAAGCIFAEMLLRKPLFPGNDYLHQLKLIIKFLGTPKQEDIGFVKNTKALRFLTKLAISKPKKWRDVFAETGVDHLVSSDAIDLLSKMLLFNPEKRISVDAALRHPYLAPFLDENDLMISRSFDFSFDLPDENATFNRTLSSANRLFRMGMTA
ncbi:unnamed protein product [Peronospora destructor]|uniref:Mitogen-activated protein kinase n=1 Tax=Peronospora destructor TaxID=86335 RepID=A0AAV0V3F7_9STRA|nr:unnamed protein product [Peronospora destructor]